MTADNSKTVLSLTIRTISNTLPHSWTSQKSSKKFSIVGKTGYTEKLRLQWKLKTKNGATKWVQTVFAIR